MTGRQQALVAVTVVMVVFALVMTGLGARRGSPPSGTPSAEAVAAAQPVPVQPAPVSATARAVPAGSWVTATSSATGIPAPAIRAYGAAALAVSVAQPRCHLGWNTLAGIGDIESVHGTIGGRALLADGRSSTAVVGPALSGEGGFAALAPEPWSSAIHHDERFDHALGPLQFVTTTWRDWAADGDRDGRSDPLDLDDAALAAGRYLCANRHDLATAAGWHAAVLSYNHSETYVTAVLGAADSYARTSQ